MKKLFLFVLVLSVFFFTERSNAADESIVSFRLVCKEQSADCFLATKKDTKGDIFVKKIPVLTLADIKSASIKKHHDPSPRAIEFLKSQGYKDEDIPKHDYRLLLKFNDPKILGRITSMNVGQTLAILINGDLTSTPYIQKPFMGDELEVLWLSKTFTEQMLQAYADEINKAILVKKTGVSN